MPNVFVDVTDINSALHNISIAFTEADKVYPSTKDLRKAMNADANLKPIETNIKNTKFFKHISKQRINRYSYYMIGFILVLLGIIGVVIWQIYECKQNKNNDCVYSCGSKSNSIVTYKNTKWPAMDKNHAFSIKIIDKNLRPEMPDSKDQEFCLQTDPNNKLILKQGCDDDSVRFIAKADGKLQKFKETKCLNPENIDKKAPSEIIYTNNCTDNDKEDDIGRLNFTFESDGRIKHPSSNRCIFAPITGTNPVTLGDCNYGTKFELI